MVKGEVIVLNIRFHGSPITMTAATLPMLYLWLNRYSVETLGLWLSHLIDCGDPAMSKNPDKCCTNHVVIHKVYTLQGLAWPSCNVSVLLFGRLIMWRHVPSCNKLWLLYDLSVCVCPLHLKVHLTSRQGLDLSCFLQDASCFLRAVPEVSTCRSHLGFFALVLDVASTALALFFGLSPAFFPRVDHPLHSLDRMRWLSGCAGIVLLFL